MYVQLFQSARQTKQIDQSIWQCEPSVPQQICISLKLLQLWMIIYRIINRNIAALYFYSLNYKSKHEMDDFAHEYCQIPLRTTERAVSKFQLTWTHKGKPKGKGDSRSKSGKKNPIGKERPTEGKKELVAHRPTLRPTAGFDLSLHWSSILLGQLLYSEIEDMK